MGVGPSTAGGQERTAPKLGEVLVAAGVITQVQLMTALQEQASEHPPRRLGQILVSKGMLTEDRLARALAGQLRLGYVDLPSMALAPEIVRFFCTSGSRLKFNGCGPQPTLMI